MTRNLGISVLAASDQYVEKAARMRLDRLHMAKLRAVNSVLTLGSALMWDRLYRRQSWRQAGFLAGFVGPHQMKPARKRACRQDWRRYGLRP